MISTTGHHHVNVLLTSRHKSHVHIPQIQVPIFMNPALLKIATFCSNPPTESQTIKSKLSAPTIPTSSQSPCLGIGELWVCIAPQELLLHIHMLSLHDIRDVSSYFLFCVQKGSSQKSILGPFGTWYPWKGQVFKCKSCDSWIILLYTENIPKTAVCSGTF